MQGKHQRLFLGGVKDLPAFKEEEQEDLKAGLNPSTTQELPNCEPVASELDFYARYTEALKTHQAELVLRNQGLSFQKRQDMPGFLGCSEKAKEQLAVRAQLMLARLKKAQALLTFTAAPWVEGRFLDRRHAATEAAQESASNLADAHAQLVQFLEKEYNPAARVADSEFNPQINALALRVQSMQEQIELWAQRLSELDEQKRVRWAFLIEAAAALKGYQEVLEAHTGLHVPFQKIPQADLKRYLEADSRVSDDLDKMYTLAQESSRFYGLHPSNLLSQISRYTPWSGPTSYDEDLSRLAASIRYKIDSVHQELSYQGLTSKSNAVLADLQAQQIIIQEQSQELVKEKESLEKQEEELNSAKKNALQSVERQKQEKEQIYYCALVGHELSLTEQDCAALLLNICRLESHLVGILSRQRDLVQIYEELNSKGTDQALPYLQAMEQGIAEMNLSFLMHRKREGETHTADELWQLTRAQCSELLARDLQKNTTKLSECPAELSACHQLMQEELKKQKERWDCLEEKIGAAEATNSEYTILFHNKKMVLTALRDLMQIQETFQDQYPEFLETECLAPVKKKARKELLQGIEAFRLKTQAVVQRCPEISDHSVQSLLRTVLDLDKKLAEKYDVLRLEHIDEYASVLLQRFPAKTEADRIRLLEQVDYFEQKELPFIHSISERTGRNTRGIESKILQIQHRKTSLFIPFVRDIPDLPFAAKMSVLSKQFFGTSPNAGVFSEYFKERSKTFWFGDLFCKSQRQGRQKFVLEELRPALNAYAACQGKETAAYNNLIDLLEKGQKKFKPRAKVGHKDHEKTLYSKLQQLKSEIKKFEVVRRQEQAEIEEMHNAFGLFR